MTISYIKADDLLKIESTEFTALLADTDQTVVLEATITCGTTVYTRTIPIDDIHIEGDYDFYIDEDDTTNSIMVKPAFFGLTTFIDGIYNIKVIFNLNLTGDHTSLSNCIFVDITLKCKVAALLQNILKENASLDDTEKVSTIIHLLHYALVNGSNCGCNCSELCKVYDELICLLTNVNPQILNDCGC